MFYKVVILSLLFLNSCVGPTLFTVAGLKVTVGTALTMPSKIETYEKYKKEKE
jgi:hypothetical protein